MLFLLAGCTRPVLLVDSTEPAYGGEALSRTYFVYPDAAALVFNSSASPAAAVASDPRGIYLARAIVVDDKLWVMLYSLKNGNIASSYKLPGDVSGTIELHWPLTMWLIVLSGDRVFAISPGQEPVNIGYARGLVFAPTSMEVTIFGGVDIPKKSRLGVCLDAPQGLRPICFHPDGKSYLALDEEGALHLVDKKTGADHRLTLDLPGHPPSKAGNAPLRVVDACFAPDGREFFITGVVNDRLQLLRGPAKGPKAFSLLLPVQEAGGREKIEIAGFVGRALYLVVDDSDIIRYTPANRSVETVFSTGGRINAFCPLP